VIAHEGCF